MRCFFALLILFNSITALASIEFYYGDVEFLSPDGQSSFGKTVSLVKREILLQQSTIIETVVQPGQQPGQKAEKHVATMVRIGNSQKFTVSDGDKYKGFLTFKGPDWKWTGWIYDIQMKSGEKITGSGSLDLEGIKTKKTFWNENTPTVLIHEDLKKISEKKYEKLFSELMGSF